MITDPGRGFKPGPLVHQLVKCKLQSTKSDILRGHNDQSPSEWCKCSPNAQGKSRLGTAIIPIFDLLFTVVLKTRLDWDGVSGTDSLSSAKSLSGPVLDSDPFGTDTV